MYTLYSSSWMNSQLPITYQGLSRVQTYDFLLSFRIIKYEENHYER